MDKSKIEGVGFFAKIAFKAGDIVADYGSKIISVTEAEEIFANGSDYILQVSNSEFLDLHEEEARFINHSCNPNAAFLKEPGKLIALRDIVPGEEVTFDYSANENTYFKMKCLCGETNCRKEIGPYSSLTAEEKLSVENRLTPYLRNSKN